MDQAAKKKLLVVRPGEKLHEEMITSADSYTTYDLGEYYAILPADKTMEKYQQQYKGKIETTKAGFAYNSGTNPQFLKVEEIRELISRNVDSNFTPI